MIKIISTLIFAALTTTSYANSVPTLTLGASLDTQLGFRNEDGIFNYLDGNNTSGKRNSYAIVNDTKISIKLDNKIDDISYGGKIVLNADASNNKFNNEDSGNIGYETVFHTDSNFGRVEIGTTTSIYNSMSVSAADVAHATGGASNGDSIYWINSTMFKERSYFSQFSDFDRIGFVRREGLYSNQQTGGSTHAARINYYTPTYMGFKAGISYTPDMKIKGTVSTSQAVGSQYILTDNDSFNTFKKIVTGAVNYESNIKDVRLKIGISGEKGIVKKYGFSPNESFKNLASIEGGLKLNYQQFSTAISYANLGKSAQSKQVIIKATKYWTAGVAYEFNGFGTSATYFGSKKSTNINDVNGVSFQGYNKTQNWAIGADYMLASGLLPYIEYTNFKYKYAFNSSPMNKGNVVLAGTKIQF